MEILIPHGPPITTTSGIEVGRNSWTPNPGQAEFLSLPYSIKEALYGGGAGSGKTDVVIFYALCHKFHLNPRFKQVLMRRMTQQLKKEILPRTEDIYPKFGAKLNRSDLVWTFPREDQFGSGMRPSGAMIFLAHCEEEKNVHNFDSMEISLFSPDEITSLTEYIYNYIAFERVRVPEGSGLVGLIRAAGMPGDIGHKFVKKRFIDHGKEGRKVIVGRGGIKRIFIHATYLDNKGNIDSSYGQSLDARPEAERKAKKFGDWDAYLGTVFDEFRDRKYPDEPENALHVVKPFEIPDWWPKMVIGDWGFAAMCYIGFYAISPSKRVYLYRELSWTKTKIAVWGEIVRNYIEAEKPRVVKFCQSAGQDRGEDQTLQQQIEEAIGHTVELSGNVAGSRVSGKMLVHEYLRFRELPPVPVSEEIKFDQVYAEWLYRNKSEREFQSYMNLFQVPEPERNLPKLQIFLCDPDETNHEGHANCCPLMIGSIKACNYPPAKNDGKAVEDVMEFDGDDPYDDLRYALQSAERYYDEAKAEFDRIQKEAQIVQRLTSNHDMTAFYRQMSSTHKVTAMVSRFHRRRR